MLCPRKMNLRSKTSKIRVSNKLKFILHDKNNKYLHILGKSSPIIKQSVIIHQRDQLLILDSLIKTNVYQENRYGRIKESTFFNTLSKASLIAEYISSIDLVNPWKYQYSCGAPHGGHLQPFLSFFVKDSKITLLILEQPQPQIKTSEKNPKHHSSLLLLRHITSHS